MMPMTTLQLLELKLGDKYTSKVIMKEMHDLDCMLTPGTKEAKNRRSASKLLASSRQKSSVEWAM
jgi:hypothetical protein